MKERKHLEVVCKRLGGSFKQRTLRSMWLRHTRSHTSPTMSTIQDCIRTHNTIYRRWQYYTVLGSLLGVARGSNVLGSRSNDWNYGTQTSHNAVPISKPYDMTET